MLETLTEKRTRTISRTKKEGFFTILPKPIFPVDSLPFCVGNIHRNGWSDLEDPDPTYPAFPRGTVREWR